MRPSFDITSKLFVALFVPSIAVALAMGAAVRWRLDANLLDYVNAREAERIAVLVQNVESAYTQHGGWDFLHDDRMARFSLPRCEGTRARADGMGGDRLDPPPGHRFDPLPPGIEKDAPLPPGPPTVGRSPPHPPGEPPTPHSPIWLLDTQRSVIIGDGPPLGPNTRWQKLCHNGQTVGWSAMPPRMRAPEGTDQAFQV